MSEKTAMMPFAAEEMNGTSKKAKVKMAEIIKVVRENVPAMRFIGKYNGPHVKTTLEELIVNKY